MRRLGALLVVACAGLSACAAPLRVAPVTSPLRPSVVVAPRPLDARPLTTALRVPTPILPSRMPTLPSLTPIVGEPMAGEAQVIIRRFAPTITALSVSTGAVATSVTITGRDFGTAQENSVLTFNGTVATASAWSNTSITTTVPTGATTGSVLILRGGLTSNGLTFTVTSGAAWSCTGTPVAAGTNLATHASSAVAGTTYCLASGNYAGFDIIDVSKASRVIYKAATQYGAVFTSGVRFYRANNFTYNGITWSGLSVDDSPAASHTANVSILNGDFNGGQLFINVSGWSGGTANVLIDSNLFRNYTASGSDGIFVIQRNPTSGTNHGITISNNDFNAAGNDCMDGLDLISVSGGIVVGPGNVFRNFTQGTCGTHVDAVQDQGSADIDFHGNRVEDSEVMLGFYDNGDRWDIYDNVFARGLHTGSDQQFQMGGYDGLLFHHNTLCDVTMAVGTKPAVTANRNWVVENNVYSCGSQVLFTAVVGGTPGCPTSCTWRYNVFETSGANDAGGTNITIGTVTFMGGASPSTWAGFQLTSGSVGHAAGNDGRDLGTTYYGP